MPSDESFSKEKAALISTLHEALEPARPERRYSADTGRQNEVFDNLPADLVDRLRGHLAGAISENHDQTSKRGLVERSVDAESETAGELFEVLVENDPYFAKKYGERTPLEVELVSIMHDPDHFGLGLGDIRNPDLAFIKHTAGGEVVITAVGEAKMGRLGGRALSQLRHFKSSVEQVAAGLNSATNLSEEELPEVSRLKLSSSRPDFIRVADTLTQVLVIPADRNPRDVDSLISSDPRDISDREYDDLANLLEDGRSITIEKAAFSGREVWAMAQALLPEVVGNK